MSNLELPIKGGRLNDLIPQRFECQYIDRVTDYSITDNSKFKDSAITAEYRVPEDSWWRLGHIPGDPLMPGVLIGECANQAAAALFSLCVGGGFCQLSKQCIRFHGSVTLKDLLQIHITINFIKMKVGNAKFTIYKLKEDTKVLIADGEITGILLNG
ncbi:MAG: hypothetical protein ACD_58C00273G0006 [uncultured bacterium]|nr:MAG: hypothetical protein ACD_58C00273G0006 [uncultured bacterium]